MTPDELKTNVWQLIDDNCMEFSQQDYLEFLYELRDDSGIRAEAVETDISESND
jgi:hypothetical protein